MGCANDIPFKSIGAIFGWGQLLLIWEKENVYRELCSADAPPDVPCGEQENHFNLMYLLPIILSTVHICLFGYV
jgi:hypothetical protein